MYNYNALSVALANAFREKGKPVESYPSKPFELEKKTGIEKEKQEEQDALFAEAYMMQMVHAGKNWGRK